MCSFTASSALVLFTVLKRGTDNPSEFSLPSHYSPLSSPRTEPSIDLTLHIPSEARTLSQEQGCVEWMSAQNWSISLGEMWWMDTIA